MEFLYIKAIHIVFVVTWFAGLFYLPRLMVYTAEANAMDEPTRGILINQYLLMQKRLLYGITWPSAILTLLLGTRLLMLYPLESWLIVKLCFVVLLYFFHFSLQYIFNQQRTGNFKFSGQQLRMWNEVPTVILIAVVFLVILKSTMAMGWGLLGLFLLIIILMLAIRLYKRFRQKNAAK
jgi:putative membrane protein